MERSSPSRVAGRVTRDVTILGKTYTLSECEKVGTYALQEELILSRRLDPLAFGLRACDKLTPNKHAAVWEGCAAAASRGIASEEEWASYEASLWKPAFMLWQALDSKHKRDASGLPRPLKDGVAWAVELIHAMSREEFALMVNSITAVSQVDQLKNSSGSIPLEDKPLTDTPSTPDTQPSTLS